MGQAKLKGNTREERVAKLLEAHSAKMLSYERFNAFIAWTRSPILALFGEETQYFSSLNESVLGVIVRDHADDDYGYTVLGRDKKLRFRAIKIQCSMSRTEARAALLAHLKSFHDAGITIFPQGDEDEGAAGIDLFSLAVPPEKLHPSFDSVCRGDHWLPARSIMSEMMRHFIDVDGNFVEQFQTTGFDARVWELYLYAALLELGLFVSKPDPAPDFLVTDGKRKIFIEAVTVNSTSGEPLPRPEDPPAMRSPESILELNKSKIPIKYRNALWKKLKRKTPYWTLPDVRGCPLVFAIADFHEKQSMTWTSTGLFHYLYGQSHEFWRDDDGKLIVSSNPIEVHEYEGKRVPSGFFMQPDAQNISAVIFSASGTISKFNRMGRFAGFGHPDQVMMRMGFKHRHDENATVPDYFTIDVQPGKATEKWAEGISMFHNPNALHPVDPEIFPGIAHHFFKDGEIVSILPEFYPYWSQTFNILPSKNEAGPTGSVDEDLIAASSFDREKQSGE